ncbi:MAG TPA: DNA ligase D [Solirubrobacteraceae bacterium]|nr:DNA ligase D [Solirubrobacteraceae bacterium]
MAARSTEKDKLSAYRGKREAGKTPEPAGGLAGAGEEDGGRFVIQEHHATRLHWDLRLEHDGVLASWAIPNGIPPDREENRLAVHTEDHPIEYLEFHGEIPKGQYGAGTMTIWDTGTYEAHKWADDKVEVTFHGERLTGRYGLFPIGRRSDGSGNPNDWMIHRMDPPQDPDREPMPEHLPPMLAGAGTLPTDDARWSFEVKWDGVRAIAYARPGRLRLESRNLNEITQAYPEVRGLSEQLGMREAVLDGEIVAFGEDGAPSFERLQRRMHVSAPSAIARLQKSTPVVFAIFDVLYLDGRSLMGLPYEQRRARLEQLALGGPAWRVPAAFRGSARPGAELLKATAAQGLEGVVAKRLDSRYEPGRRTGAWIKVKNMNRQELVIVGWLPGEGRRERRIGALLMGVREPPTAPSSNAPGPLRYAGRVGTGFTERTLDELATRLKPLVTDNQPFDPMPKLPRNAIYVRPELIAEVEFREWTSEGVMRAPSFKGLRDDKSSAQVVREVAPDAHDDRETSGQGPESLFDTVERRPDGGLAVTLDGRALTISNWDKVLYPETGFTKGDLVSYYARIAPVAIPHLKDRALTLKRYPNGVDQQFFYEKNSPSHRPRWVQTARVGGIDYTLCQERATLVWLANLADIELHTSLSHVDSSGRGSESPSMLVFDLDPGAPAALPECCEVALVLNGLFAQLRLESVVKVSGSKGMQVYVPLNSGANYAQTKPWARSVAEALEQRLPKLVVSRMTKRLREGRVLVDWSQNDAHKTTVTVYSLRARERPRVSAPVSWEEVAACRDARDSEMLSFGPEQVLERVARDGDRFAMLESTSQSLPGAG